MLDVHDLPFGEMGSEIIIFFFIFFFDFKMFMKNKDFFLDFFPEAIPRRVLVQICRPDLGGHVGKKARRSAIQYRVTLPECSLIRSFVSARTLECGLPSQLDTVVFFTQARAARTARAVLGGTCASIGSISSPYLSPWFVWILAYIYYSS